MPPPQEIIDLTLDSDDEDPAPEPAAWEAQLARLDDGFREQHDHANDAQVEVDDDEYFHIPGQFEDHPIHARGHLANVPLVIDDFGYLEEDAQQQDGAGQEEQNNELARALQEDQQDQQNQYEILTKDGCLARVYEMFPDVCPEHTEALYDQLGAESDIELLAAVRLDRIIETLITDAPYPKRKKDTQHLKRKREESVEDEYKQWERDDREAFPRFLAGSVRSILKAEFPTFTHASINQIIGQEKYLFKSYVRLATLRDTDGHPRRGRPSGLANADVIVANSGWHPLGLELAAARKRAQEDRALRVEQMAKKQAEAENLQRAIAAGRTAECQACFDDLPMNRQVHCHGDEPHFTCFSCIETYIKSEIGDARCRILCTAGCGAGFEPAQLNLVADKKLLQKLAELQQEKDIRDAGLEDLEECPFCDYKAIMPPVEEDFEFRCANPDCEKVSCRRCKSTSHIPISCEQYAKDKKANSRHTIEEAMTAALIRSCNRCKKQFIKEWGCNKMTCPSCSNLQCYVCSETLKGYDHFDQSPNGDPRPGGKCPLYDNLEERHEREIRAAEETARAQVVAANPDVAPEDLEIRVSDAVKKSTEDKIQRARPQGPLGQGLGGGHAPRFVDPGWMEAIGGLEDLEAEQRERLNDVLNLHNRMPPLPRRRGVRDAFVAGAAAADVDRVVDDAIVRRRRRMREQINAQRQQALREAEEARARQRQEQHNADLRGMQDFINRDRARPMPHLQQPNDPGFAMNGINQLLGFAGNIADIPLPRRRPPRALQQPLQQHAQPPAVVNNAEQLPFERDPAPNDFGILRNPFLQDMFNVDPAPPARPMPDPNMQLNRDGMANVMRNLHQLELLRQQHDARHGNVPAPGQRAGARRRRVH